MELYIDDQENLIEVSDYAYDPEGFDELEEDHKDDSEYSYDPESFENLADE